MRGLQATARPALVRPALGLATRFVPFCHLPSQHPHPWASLPHPLHPTRAAAAVSRAPQGSSISRVLWFIPEPGWSKARGLVEPLVDSEVGSRSGRASNPYADPGSVRSRTFSDFLHVVPSQGAVTRPPAEMARGKVT